ncbi:MULTISPECIES: DUF4345 family protein [unclassified Aureimonas]|uniref:AGROH133_08824 family phage infection protein n=1 Tax=unclassified Aureimonas TaxID=2615206 RepID=UPI0007216C66|nr:MULTISPECIES: DUF4345 family protein [unclassified Aureimonas]ALN71345.1 hypothetical protein M673_01380 [Aureimonas sp. AU20]
MSLVLPDNLPDLLPFLAACISVVYGLFAMFAPRLFLRAHGLDTMEARRTGLAEIRGTIAGFPLGLGVALLTLGSYQTLIQLSIGAAWLFVAFGRLVSILSDQGASILNWTLFLFNLALAALCLAPAFGLVSA